MPAAGVTNLLRVVMDWSGFGEIGTLTWFFAGSAETHTSAQLKTALNTAIANMNTSTDPSTTLLLRRYFDTHQTINDLTVYEYADSRNPATSQASSSINVAGSQACVHPLQVALCITTLSDTPGASFRGRQYWPGHTVAVSSGDPRAAGADTDAVALLASNLAEDIRQGLQTALSIDTLNWVVFSRKLGEVSEITSLRVDNVLDTQRRREASLTATHTSTQAVSTDA